MPKTLTKSLFTWWHRFLYLMMGMFWEKHWSLKWNARGSEDEQRRHGRCKWRRRARVLVLRRRMPWIEWDREWELELERLLLEWGKSGYPHLPGINLDQNWIDWLKKGFFLWFGKLFIHVVSTHFKLLYLELQTSLYTIKQLHIWILKLRSLQLFCVQMHQRSMVYCL